MVRAAPDPASATVLFVDGDDRLVERLAAAVRSPRWRVLMAGSAEEGLYLCRRHAVDVVVAGRQLPGLDGPSLCRHLLSLGDSAVILLSDGDPPETRARWLEDGAADCVDRDGEPAVLRARIDAVQRRRVPASVGPARRA